MSELQSTQSPEWEEIDVKEILFKLLRHWRLFVIMGFIGVAVAYIINRYSTNIYKLSTLINIKESENPLATSSMNLMFKWGGTSELMQSHIAILKSRRHNLKIIDRLNLEVEYYSAGRIKLNNAYDRAPFYVEFDKSSYQPVGVPFEVIIHPDNSYTIEYELEDEKALKGMRFSDGMVDLFPQIDLKGTYEFGQWVETPVSRFRLLEKEVKDSVDNHVSYYFKFASPKKRVDRYVKSLDITETSEGGSLLEIAMTGDSKERITKYLNMSVQLLKEHELEEKNRLADNTIMFVDMQMSGVVDTLRSVEEELQNFRVEHEVVDLSSESSELYSKFMELETQRAELVLAEKYYEYLQDYLNKADDYSTLMTPSVVGIEDPVLLELVGRLVELSVDRNRMQYSLQSENPFIVQVESEINITKKSLNENVKSLIRATQLQEADIEKRLSKVRDKLSQLPSIEQELINIRRKYELTSTQYDFLVQKRAEAELLRAGNLPDTQVIDEAVDYGDLPIKPKRLINLVIGLLLGLAFPAIYIFVRDFFNNTIESKKELESATRIPIIGSVGHSSGTSNIVIKNGLKSSVAESFRVIRANLKFIFKQKTGGESDAKVIVVTSSIGGEGKTFCSINLSSIISIAGSKTVIVGMDLRKPKIFNDFNFTNNHGLSEYLSGQLGLEGIIKSTDIDNLDFITAGPVPPNPGELLMSQKVDVLIEELKRKYDYIILDTPPITLVSDALELMKYADATLYVVRQNYTQREMLSVINEQFNTRGLANISIIFNDVIRGGYGYDYGYNYGYNYGYGYGYYDEDEQKLPWWKRLI